MYKRTHLNIEINDDASCKIDLDTSGSGNNHTSKIQPNGTFSIVQDKYCSVDVSNGSLNFSKTISNASIQTMRISKNSLLSSLIQQNSLHATDRKDQAGSKSFKKPPIDSFINCEDLVEEDFEDEKCLSSSKLNSNRDSTKSIVLVKKDKALEISNKSIFYTPSTICNYYQHSNEVTPFHSNNTRDIMNSNVKQKLRLDLVNIKDNSDNNNNSARNRNIFEDSLPDGSENIVSSSRNNIYCTEDINSFHNFKKTPIKYTRSQLKSADKDRSSNKPCPSSSSRDRPSPFMNIFKINSKTIDCNLNDIAKEIKKELVLNISEIDIEDKLINNNDGENIHTAPTMQTPNPTNFLDRINLQFTFNKLLEDEKSNCKTEYTFEPAEKGPKQVENVASKVNAVLPRHENLSFDINSASSSANNKKEQNINKAGKDSTKLNNYPNLKSLISRKKPESTNDFHTIYNQSHTHSNAVSRPKSKSSRKHSQSSNKTGKSDCYDSNYKCYTTNTRVNTANTDKNSPKITSNIKTTENSSSNKSKSSSSKKQLQFSTNTQIKQFLLNMIAESDKTSKVKISNNININKIVIQQPKTTIVEPRSTVKKSNSISSGSQKQKYIDLYKLNSVRSQNNLILNPKPVTNSKSRLSALYLGSQNKVRSSSRDSKAFELTLNYEQNHSTKASNNNPKINLNKSKSPPETRKGSSTKNKVANVKTESSIRSENFVIKDSDKAEVINTNTLVCNTVVSTQKRNPKIIENFSNYSKKSNKPIHKIQKNGDTLQTLTHNYSNSSQNLLVSKQIKTNIAQNSPSPKLQKGNKVDKVNFTKRQTMSNKIQFLCGDEDPMIEDY